MSCPHLRHTRCLPSPRVSNVTRVALLQLLQMSCTFDSGIGISFSTMPACVTPCCVFLCRFTMFTPVTITLSGVTFGRWPFTFTRSPPPMTCRTTPVFPASFPCNTSTLSSRLIFLMPLHHLRRQGDDLHEVPVAQLARHGTEDARALRVLLVR